MTLFARRACALLCLIAFTWGCGYKGPLVLPQSAEENQQDQTPVSEDAQDQRENS